MTPTTTILPPFNLPTPIILLITDELSSPADFLLHRCLHQHLNLDKNNRVVVLSVSESLARWKSVASRSNVNLDNGSVEFIDVMSHVSPVPIRPDTSDTPSANTLRPIFDIVLKSLNGSNEVNDIAESSKLVILDDISTLEWIGFTSDDVVRFVRALRGACIKTNATLIVRHHRVSNDVASDDLFSHLYQMCTYHLEVRGLASGRSGSVSGEIALHAGPGTAPTKDSVNLLPRSCAMQYRLTDTSAVFFEKGTGGAVL
ncbi:hypothetical protein JOM56_005553 [Amanita muscaria]